jgi:hypothetical protein
MPLKRPRIIYSLSPLSLVMSWESLPKFLHKGVFVMSGSVYYMFQDGQWL